MTERVLLSFVFGSGLQTLHGAVQSDLGLVILVHALLLMLQALFGADAGGLLRPAASGSLFTLVTKHFLFHNKKSPLL